MAGDWSDWEWADGWYESAWDDSTDLPFLETKGDVFTIDLESIPGPKILWLDAVWRLEVPDLNDDPHDRY